jgi:16S rRNA (adenine1518-N6/adenine1519-N6)-dimethyltransferase
MKLPEMRQLLSVHGIQLTKSLGQNFLHEEKVIARIAQAGELTRGDKVLEIGPGLGPLTTVLLQQAAEVLAIETDARLVDLLRKRWEEGSLAGTPDAPLPGIQPKGPPPVFRILYADALKFLEDQTHDWRGWKVVSNLPYSVASPILVELALAAHGPDRMVVTLQLEVARRLKAGANDDDYGLLTLLVQLNYQPGAMFKISSGCFFPQPNVDSACLTLLRRPKPLLDAGLTKPFVRIVKQAFSQRRKMMAKLLRADWPDAQLAAAMEKLRLSPQIRAEAVTLHQFVELTQLLAGDTGLVPPEPPTARDKVP